MQEDITYVLIVVAKTAGEIGMTKSGLENTNNLLLRYGDEREELLEEMLSLLAGAKSSSDTSSLRDAWRSRCDEGKNLLERLDGEIPSTPIGEGLVGVGAKDFAAGEKKIWEENAKADIASAANIMRVIHKADLELIEQCKKDLKTVRDGDIAVEALIQRNFGGMLGRLKDLAMTSIPKLVATAVNSQVKDRFSKEYFKSWGEFLSNSLKENLKAAEQKRAFKQIILQNIEFINKTKEQLSEEWIEEVYKKGEEFAKSLRGVGANGNYEARDWNKFGEESIKELAEMRNFAKEKSKEVFGELLPIFIAENNKAFAALTDDASTLANWKNEMENEFKSIDEALTKAEDINNDLVEGPYRQAAKESYVEIRNLFSKSINDFVTETKNAEEKMKE